MLFVPAWIPRTVLAKTEPQVDKKALAKQAEALTKKITSQRQAIDKEKFPEAAKLLAQIEKKAEDLAKAPPAQKDKLMVEMNKLTDALKERRKQLGSPDQVNRQLQQLKAMGQNGPADQFAKELAKGDFKKAADQLKQLQEKMQKGEMTQAEKKALQEQLGEMSKKLNDLANMEQRKKQLDEALKNGGLSKEQYEREVEKLKQQSKSLRQLQEIASKLGQAQEALQKGDAKKAAESLGMTQQQLSQMAKQLDEMDSLDSTLADVQDAKNGMNDDGMNQLGQMMDGMGNMNGMRKGNGNGARPRPRHGRPPRSPRRDGHLHHQGPAANQEGQGRASGLHPAEQDRQGRERDRHPGRDGSRHGLGRRGALEPAHPEERREAHPGVLRPDQQGKMIRQRFRPSSALRADSGAGDSGSIRGESRASSRTLHPFGEWCFHERFDPLAPRTGVIYPDSDGQPMADNTLQFRWIVTIKEGLAHLFMDRPDVFVAGDLLWYPVEGDPKTRIAPDAMVAFGRPKGDRGSYKQWEEGGIAPQVVFEVLSPGNRPRGDGEEASLL